MRPMPAEIIKNEAKKSSKSMTDLLLFVSAAIKSPGMPLAISYVPLRLCRAPRRTGLPHRAR